jgi:hypothetical protein
MRIRVCTAVLFVSAALLLGGVFLLGGSAVDLPSATAAGTVEQVSVWAVVSRVGTLAFVVGGPIAFIYWLATVNVGGVPPPGGHHRDRSAPESVEDATYETARKKSN